MNKKTIAFTITTLLFWTALLGKEQLFENEFDSSIEKVLNQKLSKLSGDVAPEPDFVKVKKDPGYPVSEKDSEAVPAKGKKSKFVDINYNMAPLVQVINDIAQAKGVNVILPTGANAITSTLTLTLDQRTPIKKAWKLLYTILEVGGYSLIKRRNGYLIVRNDQNSLREPLPIYIGVPPEDLPDTDKKIRYLYYLSNIQVPEAPTGDLHTLLNILLTDARNFVRYFPQSNGLVMVDKARIIKAAMKVVMELDKVGFKERVDIIKLTHTSAQTIANLFNKNILEPVQKARPARNRGVGWKGKSRADYFSYNTKIIPEKRTNSLIVVGTHQAIERIREFIFKYIDVKLDSGKSILHTYQLKYLDAYEFSKTLTNIVQSSVRAMGGTGQSRAAGTAIGPERFFEDVKIATDTGEFQASGALPAATEISQSAYAGSNQLIIAARGDDWIRLKKLIEELDRPQPQVIIEVLVADLSLEDERVLGSHTRTPAALNLPQPLQDGNLEFQSAQPGPAVANYDAATPADSSIHVDLMRDNFTTSGPNPQTIDPLSAVATGGSTIVTLSDNNGNVWSLLQILQSYSNSKILSHPHVIATNNKEAKVSIGESRLLRATATIGTGGAAIAKKEQKDADLTVTITPRLTGGKVVNLQVKVGLVEFIGDSGDRITRDVITNANVKDGSILALGGLIRVETTQGLNETPILGRLPLIGWLFKRRRGNKQKNNLTVFIRPTVVQPRLRGGIDKYTKDYIRLAKNYAKEGMLFDTLRDPITRWFFQTGVDAEAAIDVFAQEGVPAPIDEEFFAKSDRPAMPTFTKDPNRTVLAAIEGRAPVSASGKLLRAGQPSSSDSKKLSVPVPSKQTSVLASEELSPSEQKEKSDEVQEPVVVAQADPPPKPTDPPIVAVARKEKDRDEQLKQLLSQFDNPLLANAQTG